MTQPSLQQNGIANHSSHVCALLIVLCIVCGALAVVFYRQSSERQEMLVRMQKKQGQKTGNETTAGDPSSRGSEQVFKQVNLLAQKDAVISELRQRMIALQEGKIPEARLSQNTLPKSVRSSRQHKPAERPAELAPPPRADVVRPVRTAPVPVFRNLAQQEQFLRSLDVTSMPAAEQDDHKQLLKHMETLNRIVDELGRNRGTDPDSDLRRILRREEQTIQALMRQERQSLLCNIGRDLGYDDESSLLFAEYVEKITAMTAFETSPQQMPGPVPASPDTPESTEPEGM